MGGLVLGFEFSVDRDCTYLQGVVDEIPRVVVGVFLTLSLAGFGQNSASITGTVTDQRARLFPTRKLQSAARIAASTAPPPPTPVATFSWLACLQARSTTIVMPRL